MIGCRSWVRKKKFFFSFLLKKETLEEEENKWLGECGWMSCLGEEEEEEE